MTGTITGNIRIDKRPAEAMHMFSHKSMDHEVWLTPDMRLTYGSQKHRIKLGRMYEVTVTDGHRMRVTRDDVFPWYKTVAWWLLNRWAQIRGRKIRQPVQFWISNSDGRFIPVDPNAEEED